MKHEKWKEWLELIRDASTLVHASLFGEEYKDLIIYHPDRIGLESIRQHDCVYDVFVTCMEKMRKSMQDSSDYLDRHKIIAAFVKALLLCPIFEYDEIKVKEQFHGQVPARIKYPNEFFVVFFIRDVLTRFCIANREKYSDWKAGDFSLKFPEFIYFFSEDEVIVSDYDEYFANLVHFYSQQTRIDKFPLFAFANILWFIEMANDCANLGLSSKYFGGTV